MHVTHFDNALLSRADEPDVLLYIHVGTAHTRARRHNETFNGRAFYSYGASLLQKLRGRHSNVCKKYLLSSHAFLLTRTPQKENFSLPVNKMHLNTVSLLSYDPAGKKRTLAAGAKARARCAARKVEKHLSLGEGGAPLARAAERSSPPFTPKNSHRLGKCASIQLTRLDLWLVLKTPSHRKRPPSHHKESYKVTSLVLGSETRREGESTRSRREADEWKKSTSSAETFLTTERTQAKEQKFKHG